MLMKTTRRLVSHKPVDNSGKRQNTLNLLVNGDNLVYVRFLPTATGTRGSTIDDETYRLYVAHLKLKS